MAHQPIAGYYEHRPSSARPRPGVVAILQIACVRYRIDRAAAQPQTGILRHFGIGASPGIALQNRDASFVRITLRKKTLGYRLTSRWSYWT